MKNFFFCFVLLLVPGCTGQYALVNLQTPTPEQTKAVRKATAAQCKQCQAVALRNEQATYCQACAEMKAAHKAEQNRIKHMCDPSVLGEVVELPTATATQPPADTGADLLPEAGTFKAAPQCKGGVCK